MSTTGSLYKAARMSALLTAILRGPWYLLKRMLRIWILVRWLRILPRWPR